MTCAGAEIEGKPVERVMRFERRRLPQIAFQRLRKGHLLALLQERRKRTWIGIEESLGEDPEPGGAVPGDAPLGFEDVIPLGHQLDHPGIALRPGANDADTAGALWVGDREFLRDRPTHRCARRCAHCCQPMASSKPGQVIGELAHGIGLGVRAGAGLADIPVVERQYGEVLAQRRNLRDPSPLVANRCH